MSAPASLPLAVVRQFRAFAGVGLVAAVVHYATLIGFVEGYAIDPVPATLAGYLAGGVVSYALNRRITYGSERPHREATWRFAAVAAVGFVLTYLLMSAFTWALGERWYLPAQIVTTLVVMVWSFAANRVWTFGSG